MLKKFPNICNLFLVVGNKKKGHRCDPTFVNLKSNTMKNTMQKYTILLSDANFF